MRFIFFIFLFFSILFGTASNVALSKENSGNSPYNLDFLLNFTSLSDTKKNPLSKSNGIGDWQENEFMKMRLLSCDSGTLDLKETWLGLEVEIKNGITLKNPLIKLMPSKAVKDSQIFWPIELPLNTSDGLIYKNKVLFPILVKFNVENQKMDVNISFSGLLCDENCTEEKLDVNLTLLPIVNYYTPYTAFIMRSLDFTANPANDAILKTGVLSENKLWIKANFPASIQNPSFLILNAKNNNPIEYNLIYSNISDNQGFFILKTQENVQNQDILLFMHSKNQMWQLTATALKKNIPSLFFNTKQKTIPFYMWFIFILLSPSFSFLFNLKARNEIQTQKDIFHSILCILLGTLSGAIIYTFFPYHMLLNSILWINFCIFLFLFCALSSYPLTAFSAGVLNTIVPYFIFWPKFNLTIPTQFTDLLSFFCILAVFITLPFIVFLFKPFWLIQLKKSLRYKKTIFFKFPFWMNSLIFFILLLSLFLN